MEKRQANIGKDKGKVLEKNESERKNGTYAWSYKNSQGKRTFVYATTLQELRKKEKEIQKELDNGIDSVNGKMTLNDLFYKRMKHKELKSATKENQLKMWKHRVEKSTLGNMQIKEIRKIHVDDFYTELRNDGLKKRTIGTFHSLIYNSLDYAIENDWISKNYARDCMKNFKADSKEKTPLTLEQKESLIEFCKKGIYEVYAPFLTIAIGTGLRIGELTGLQWEDVDLDKKELSVTKQLVYKNVGNGCKFFIETPKTETSTRKVPFNDDVYKAFLEHRKLSMILNRFCKTEIDGYSDFVFVNSNGQPYATNAVNFFLGNIEKTYNKVYTDNPIPHLSAHILRHTACTIYATEGMDVKALQGLMGHKDASVTMNTYNHGSVERTKNELKRLENEKKKREAM
jgi:integrase